MSLADGKITALEWAKGLDAPKGLALTGGKLYAADIDKLVEVDAKTGMILAKYDAPGAQFLNDIAADAQGRVYVSDSNTSTIWRLADGKFEKWVQGEALKFPNGLHVSGDKLIIAAWGKPGTSAQSSEPSNLVEVSLADKSVRDHGDSKPVGNLDGIEPIDDAFLVTDFVAGALYRIDRSGKAERLLDFNQGSADIAQPRRAHPTGRRPIDRRLSGGDRRRAAAIRSRDGPRVRVRRSAAGNARLSSAIALLPVGPLQRACRTAVQPDATGLSARPGDL